VENGPRALEFVENQPVDVVILDVMMPGLDGLETLREIKKNKPLIEVIMLTGHASLESGLEGMKQGAFDYIMKPTSIDDLVEKINQAYEKKTAHEGKIRSPLKEDHTE
jgi:DNA-binding NtrC family response regulator